MIQTDHQEFEQNLKAAGCSKQTIDACLCDLREEKEESLMRRLSKHRKDLLDDVHEKERCVDCLDYLVYELERNR